MIPVGENAIYKLSARYVAATMAILVVCHYFGAAPAVLIVLVGCGAAFANMVSIAFSAFILLTFIMVFNPILIPKSGMLWGLTLRGGPLLIGLCLAMTSQRRRGNFKLPLNMLGVYLLIAAICSIQGYAPKISYAKIANFGIFLWIICEATKNLQNEQSELFKLRAFLFGLTAIIILGSLAVYPYPSISTLNGLRAMSGVPGADVFLMDDYLRTTSGTFLFCGLLNHSQAFAGVSSCCFGWTVCDMLMVERRIRWPHLVIIVIAPILIFLTRSRAGFLIISVFAIMLYCYTLSRVRIPKYVKSRINQILTFFLIVGVVILAISEHKSNLVSRWLRKTDSVATDERDLSTAITASRQSVIAQNMRDFRRNRILGSGFQVAEYHVERFNGTAGIIITAPIEKGLLPLMVLGETGIVGAVFFLIFLFDFFTQCVRMRLWTTMTMFVAFFFANMAEAVFFSPGGVGGILWCFTIVGGFVCDSYVQSMQDVQFPQSYRIFSLLKR